MAKYKLKEGKSLEDFPQSGGIGRNIFLALKQNGEYNDFPGAMEIPRECLKHISKVEDKKPVEKKSTKPKRGSK